VERAIAMANADPAVGKRKRYGGNRSGVPSIPTLKTREASIAPATPP
jgi:hypothetical protein